MPTLVALFACSARQWSRQHRWTSASLRSNTFRLSYHRGLNVADELVVLFAIAEEVQQLLSPTLCAASSRNRPRHRQSNCHHPGDRHVRKDREICTEVG